MSNLRLKALLGASCAALAVVGTAQAGGFARGTADTDILFEDGNFNMRAGVTYVSPHREFSKVQPGANPALLGTSYTDAYAVPSFAAKVNLTDNFRCAGTMVDNNGGSATYAVPKPSGKLEEDFTTNEKALTCGVKFQVGPGNFWLLGGGYMEDFNYHRLNAFGPLGDATLELEGQEFGYRVGAAYEIPDIALRAQVMYRSGTSYGAEGQLNAPAGVLAGALAAQGVPSAANPFLALPANYQVPVEALGMGNLPQTVELKLQSGIAPGWLAFGSVKWADWSVQKSLDVRSKPSAAFPNGIPISSDVYNWKDGWTVTGGVGHAFTDRISGLVSLTWDSGVSTGYDFSSDTYTLAAGASLKDNIGGELRAGVGLSYLTSSEVTQGADEGFAVKSGYAVAVSAGYGIKW
ncbi:OmpP1/FadL family transporter [Mesorhizobium sp. SP-1A]|uniref:OmpP1/FadL family transporter n=1 Tax=Mesorhizobium sp. SP-1A TaxID=3077840 RepID=UPI0028F6C6FC|nr:outer membrane protein transport protein [Mesorhizobium sp. SP-1A]